MRLLSKKRLFAVIALTMFALAFTGCGKEKQSIEYQHHTFDSLSVVAWESHDTCLLRVIDSFNTLGELSAHETDFLRGIIYDRNRESQIGERYYQDVYQTTDPEKEGWDFYLKVATRLSQLRMTTSNYEGALTVATETLEKAKKAGKLTPIAESSFLWTIACCQFGLHLPEAEHTSMRVYELLDQQKDQNANALLNRLIFCHMMCNMNMDKNNLEEAELWNQRFGNGLSQLDTTLYRAFLDENLWKNRMNEIHILFGQEKDSMAMALFEQSYDLIMALPEGMQEAALILLNQRRYADVADLYDKIDAMIPEDNRFSELNLDNIYYSIIPRLQANLGSGRTDAALAFASKLADNLGKAIADFKDKNAAELATIYETQQKDAEIAQQQIKLSRQRLIGSGIALVLLTVFFLIYSWYRRRAQQHLAAAHQQLQTAYDQLEETTTAKERIESELRIARDIQMSMVPSIFPEYEGLDMYAEMNPAKEVGGDLYGYVLQGERLYFCLGDVSGKGVPASLFMAQSARLFRTLATEGMMPADIAVRMNNELSENNDRGMFVTMFIGMLHLDTGRLDFCNCGHNAPVIDGRFLEMQYDNAPLGLWEDDPFFGESIEDIRGKQLLIYTDGLNEAENKQQQLLGNARFLELMAETKSLSSHEVIDMLKTAVEKHRDGADPNDDLTLMCIRLTK